MALSDDEEKILAEIEANIRRSDPALAQQVEESSVYKYSGRKVVLSITTIVVLLAVIIFTFTNFWPVAFVSFVLMVIVGISLVDHVVKIGRASVEEARKQAKKINQTPTWRSRGFN